MKMDNKKKTKMKINLKRKKINIKINKIQKMRMK